MVLTNCIIIVSNRDHNNTAHLDPRCEYLKSTTDKRLQFIYAPQHKYVQKIETSMPPKHVRMCGSDACVARHLRLSIQHDIDVMYEQVKLLYQSYDRIMEKVKEV